MAPQLDESAPAPAAQVRRLAVRYARRVNRRWDAVKADLKAERDAVDEARGRLTAEFAQFNGLRAEFHALAAEAKDRLRQSWADIEARQKRSAAEWSETTAYFNQQEAALVARADEVAAKEQAVARAKAAAEGETAALRAEAAGLDARVANTRAALADLEQKREHLHAELLGTAVLPAPEPTEYRIPLDRANDRDLAAWAEELDARDRQLAQERAGLAVVKASLDRETAALADSRQVLAEQFVKLAEARATWQATERKTVGEMEELAAGLRVREQDLDAREGRVIKADARRREDAFDLWQLRLRLEAWQGKLTATDQRWHAERLARDAAADARLGAIARRENEIEMVFGKWEQARERERERLRAELLSWADDRDRMAAAMRHGDEKAAEVLAEVVLHAARAMAAEEALAEAVPGADKRRLELVRKHWEQAFAGKLGEIDARRREAAADMAKLDRRFIELRELLAEVTEREGEVNTRTARADLSDLLAGGVSYSEPVAVEAGADREAAELVKLRQEVERMAGVLLDAARPELPDSELPWAADEPTAVGGAGPATLPFKRAA